MTEEKPQFNTGAGIVAGFSAFVILVEVTGYQ